MFPVSWISKLRQGNENENERSSTTRISERKVNDVERNVGLQEEDKSGRVEKFYGEVKENFWRLSFSDEGVHGRKSIRGCHESLSNDWLDETEFSPSASTCRSCGAKGVSKVVKKESNSIDFNDMLLDMRKTRDSNPQVHTKSRTREPTKSKVEAVKPSQASVRISRRSPSSLSSQHLHREASAHSKLKGSECKDFGETNLAESSVGAGEERKSIYINKDSLKKRSKSGGRSSKVNVFSWISINMIA